MTILLRAKHRR